MRLPEIAQAQEIPPRFLENILNQMRLAGFVDSRRGKDGGFMLLKPPSQISVYDIIVMIDGPVYPIECAGVTPVKKCPFQGNCLFQRLTRFVPERTENAFRPRLKDPEAFFVDKPQL